MKDTDYTFGTKDEPAVGQDSRMQYRLTARARITLQLEAEYPASEGVPSSSGRALVCGIRDISVCGLCLVSTEYLAVGALFPASVTLGHQAEVFVLTVEVVWCSQDEEDYLAGVSIVESDQTAYVEWTDAVASAMETL
ncbi:PilZ domain-containing protein [Marinobacter sp.]|uniref:PilZ domain-containing protein n=1 Tax=Marinobacter sp. TaxID=50741 RepID=UPI001B3FF2F0|nr:PilZ domain-containing protein [Marinobacter sp.]MBQ0834486.1 PilZ domain-containing protein [Marinobacter sp.]